MLNVKLIDDIVSIVVPYRKLKSTNTAPIMFKLIP